MSAFLSSIKDGFNKGWSEGTIESDSFPILAQEIGKRLAKPIGSFPFWVYFIIVTFLTGLAGVFTTINQELLSNDVIINHANITLSIATYFIALLASSSTDLIFSKEESSNKHLKALGVGMLLTGVGLFWLSVIFPKHNTCALFIYLPSFFGTALALFTWWIANAHNPNLTREVKPEHINPSGAEIVDDPEILQKYKIE